MMSLLSIKDLDYELLFHLDDRTLKTISRVNRYFRQLCKDEQFWKKRSILYFGKNFEEFSKEVKNNSYYKSLSTKELYEFYTSFLYEGEVLHKNFIKNLVQGKKENVWISTHIGPIVNTVQYSRVGDRIKIIFRNWWHFLLDDDNRILFRFQMFIYSICWKKPDILRLEQLLFTGFKNLE